MATYFETTNDNNKIIIDDSISRFCVARSGFVSQCQLIAKIDLFNRYFGSFSNATKTRTMGVYQLNLNQNEKFASIYLPNDFGRYNVVFASQMDTNIIKIIIIGTYNSSDTLSDLSAKVKWYTYANNNLKSTSCGIEIFDATGNQIFTSENKYMNIMGMYSQYGVVKITQIKNVQECFLTDFYNTQHAIIINSHNVFQSGYDSTSAYASLFGIYGLSVDSNGRYLCKLGAYDFVIASTYVPENSLKIFMPHCYCSHTQFTAVDISNH